ncbi:hypothetical protein QF041_000395 [Paenibacillus sp. W2I17]|nr:hypothetical protein [Paenibacillus sp. W2I17]
MLMTYGIPFLCSVNDDSWKITVDGEIKLLTWSDQHCDVTNEEDQLLKLRMFIQQIVETKESSVYILIDLLTIPLY